MQQLAFIVSEELWWYSESPPTKDQLDSQHGCPLLYRTSSMPTLYVIPCTQILGPAAICRNPAAARIPPGGLRDCRHLPVNPCALADTGPQDSSGSELYRLNIWYMMWGSMISVQPLRYRLPALLTVGHRRRKPFDDKTFKRDWLSECRDIHGCLNPKHDTENVPFQEILRVHFQEILKPVSITLQICSCYSSATDSTNPRQELVHRGVPGCLRGGMPVIYET